MVGCSENRALVDWPCVYVDSSGFSAASRGVRLVKAGKPLLGGWLGLGIKLAYDKVEEESATCHVHMEISARR